VERLVVQAQRLLEQRGFGERRALLQFDQVCVGQRDAVYRLREALFDPAEARALLEQALEEHLDELLERPLPELADESDWDLKGLKNALREQLGVDAPLLKWVHREQLERDALAARLREAGGLRLLERLGADAARAHHAVFDALDELWADHLSELEELRSGAGLHGSAGQNPAHVFASEARNRFEAFGRGVRRLALEWTMRPSAGVAQAETEAQRARRLEREARRAVEQALLARWVRRTEPCPCGSGRRFKHCHGRLS